MSSGTNFRGKDERIQVSYPGLGKTGKRDVGTKLERRERDRAVANKTQRVEERRSEASEETSGLMLLYDGNKTCGGVELNI
jgi:hypothetical protein